MRLGPPGEGVLRRYDVAAESLSPRETTIAAIRAWAESLPGGTARLVESEAPHEMVVEIVPRNEQAARVEFRFSDYGTFGLYVGQGIRIEDLPLSEDHVLEICAAACEGRIEEETWSKGGRLLKARNVLHLPSGDLHGTEIRGLIAELRSTEHATRWYDAY